MKIKKRVRYYCDFCGKSYGRIDGAENHETHCTANPNRYCKVCDLIDNSTDISAAKKYVESVKKISDNDPWAHDLKEKDLLTAYNMVGNCPACMLAVLRQTNTFSMFDYKVEMASVFDALRKEQYYSPGVDAF